MSTSPLIYWDARWKLASAFILIVAYSFVQQWETAVACLSIGLLMVILSRLTVSQFFGRMTLIFLGIAPIVLVLPWSATDGLRHTFIIVLRAVSIGCVTIAIAQTTSRESSLSALHQLRVPSAIIRILDLTLRYSQLFFDELRRMRNSTRLRGFVWKTNVRTYQLMGQMAGTLLIRGIDRSERVADAMLCRGFNGTYHCSTEFNTRSRDVLAFIICTMIATALICWDRLE